MSLAASISDKLGALATAIPGSEPNNAAKVLLEMVGLFTGATLMKKFEIGELLGVLSGRTPASPNLLKAATFLDRIAKNETGFATLKAMVLSALSSKGVGSDAFLSLMRKISPFIDVPAPEDVDGAFDSLVSVARRVAQHPLNEVYVPAAVCVCPKCRHVFGVQG